ncbi:hypothetical protein ACFQ0B_20510 [Nonomuraea thailandensis]
MPARTGRIGPAELGPIRDHPPGSSGTTPPHLSPLKDTAVLTSLQALLGETARPKGA